MDDLLKILDQSDVPAEVKQSALTLSMQIAVPIAYQSAKLSAAGEFLTLLIELVKLLLPILLELLKPKT